MKYLTRDVLLAAAWRIEDEISDFMCNAIEYHVSGSNYQAYLEFLNILEARDIPKNGSAFDTPLIGWVNGMPPHCRQARVKFLRSLADELFPA